MNLAQLRAFHAVATAGTFSAAARALKVSQPAVTQHVKALERTIGSPLFSRVGGTLVLTPDAEDLLPKVREMMLTLDDIGARVEDGRALRSGHLSVGVCSPSLLMPILERFSTSFPGVKVDVRMENSGQLLALVARHRLDVALLTLTAPRDDLACERLVDQEVLVVVNAAHPWWTCKCLPVAELEGVPFVLREEGSMTRHIFERGLSHAGVKVAPRFVVGSREAVKEAAAQGLGAGIVLSRAVGFDPRLRAIPVDGADLSAGEYAVARPELRDRGAIREFIAIAKEVCRTLPKAGLWSNGARAQPPPIRRGRRATSARSPRREARHDG